MSKINDKLDELELSIKELTLRVVQLEEKNLPKVEEKRTLETTTNEDEEVLVLGTKSSPIPDSYRRAVDQVLNKNFGIHISYDLGGFKFAIIVPREYSNLNDEQFKMLKMDVRPRIISSAEGENGVKLWCERVFQSFDPTVQAKIVSDRNA